MYSEYEEAKPQVHGNAVHLPSCYAMAGQPVSHYP